MAYKVDWYVFSKLFCMVLWDLIFVLNIIQDEGTDNLYGSSMLIDVVVFKFQVVCRLCLCDMYSVGEITN